MSLFVIICKVTVVNATVLFEFGGGATDFFFILPEMNVKETIIFFLLWGCMLKLWRITVL